MAIIKWSKNKKEARAQLSSSSIPDAASTPASTTTSTSSPKSDLNAAANLASSPESTRSHQGGPSAASNTLDDIKSPTSNYSAENSAASMLNTKSSSSTFSYPAQPPQQQQLSTSSLNHGPAPGINGNSAFGDNQAAFPNGSSYAGPAAPRGTTNQAPRYPNDHPNNPYPPRAAPQQQQQQQQQKYPYLGPQQQQQRPRPQSNQQNNSQPPNAPPPVWQNQQQQPPQQTPQYPWSQRYISNASPFPRYGHAANHIAARDGEVFVMGGLKGSNVFGDLWVIETDTLTGYLLETEGCPSPRVGHSALSLGNAFIVFGGDTKIEETDILDDNLYLLNTNTLKWTVPNPVGPRPSGRYGHTVSTIGSTLYVFGGQLDDYFFNDLIAYDLSTLQSPNSKWVFIQPDGPSPPPRTNHTVITFEDRLYLFGGTDGKEWYTDTWCFDPRENSWSQLDCAGYIPSPCEGHSATIVGDIMYIFGGRSSDGKDLGFLSALKIPSRKWFSFQNMGPGPTPRSGHTMSAFAGHKILIMGGESPDFDVQESTDQEIASTNTVYVLDTSRINYPPSANESAKSAISPGTLVKQAVNINDQAPQTARPQSQILPRPLSQIQPQSFVPPQPEAHELPAETREPRKEGHLQSRSHSSLSELTPGYGYERVDVGGGGEDQDFYGDKSPSTKSTPAFGTGSQSSQDLVTSNDSVTTSPPPATERRDLHPEVMAVAAAAAAAGMTNGSAKPSSASATSAKLSQAITQLRESNTWYEKELAAARAAGYTSSTAPPLEAPKMEPVASTKEDAEKSMLLSALSKLKDEVEEVRESLREQAQQASEKITSAESERDAALTRVRAIEEHAGGSIADSIKYQAEISALQAELAQFKNGSAVVVGSRAPPVDSTEEYDKILAKSVGLEQQVHSLSDKVILSNHETSLLRNQLEDIQSRYKVLEQSTESHIGTITAATLTLSSTQAHLTEADKLLTGKTLECDKLVTEVTGLRTELESTKAQLLSAQQQLTDQRTLTTGVVSDSQKNIEVLNSNVAKIAALWAGAKMFERVAKSSGDRSISSDEEDEGELAPIENPEVSMLKKQLEEVTTLYTTQQRLYTETSRDLSISIDQVADLKRKVADSESQFQALQGETTTLGSKVETLEKELNSNETHYGEQLRLSTEESDGRVATLEAQMEQLKQDIAEYEERYRALESEHDTSLQYTNTSEKALSKTREELSKYKDLNTKLMDEVNSLKLQVKDDDDDEKGSIGDSDSITSKSRGTASTSGSTRGWNSRQIDLQLRDLRAQIIILQEERDDLRTKSLDLKKKLITQDEELHDAQEHIERLVREKRQQQQQQLTAAAGSSPRDVAQQHPPTTPPRSNGSSSTPAYTTPLGRVPGSFTGSHHSIATAHSPDSPVHPDEANQTLSDLSSELDRIRDERERLSGVINNNAATAGQTLQAVQATHN